MSEQIIWESGLDDKYHVKVIRTAPYIALAVITEGDKELARKETRLAFDASFGPDIADLQEWQEWAISVVDAL
jgi:hypothetical protein